MAKSSRPCYVYKMRRLTGRTWWTKVTGQSEIKIGISTKPEQREEWVDKTTHGKVRLVWQRQYANAYRVEQRLHAIFRDRNFHIRGASGGTEWFRMTAWEEMALSFWCWWLRVGPVFWLALTILLLIAFLQVFLSTYF